MSANSPPLPNFFVVGTAKSASTSIAQYLEQHPDVCFCEAHEPNFFSNDRYYNLGLEAYRRRYGHYAGEKTIGEKSWRYSCEKTYPEALDRMLDAASPFKAIYIVRDPLPRALSMWRELRDGGQDTLPADPNRALSEENIITDSSRYDSQIRRFERALGADRVLILFYEDFVADPDGFYRSLCNFLEIAQFKPDDQIHANRSVGQRSDTPLLAAMRKIGLDRPLRMITPTALRSVGRKILRSDVGDVSITPETRRRFLDLVGEDCTRLLERLDRNPAMWDLS